MAAPTAALTWAELAVALLAIGGALSGAGFAVMRSVKRGIIHRYVVEPRMKAKRAHEKVDTVERKVDNLSDTIEEVSERQELQTDGIIAVGEAISNGKDFEVEQFREEADRSRSDQFLSGED